MGLKIVQKEAPPKKTVAKMLAHKDKTKTISMRRSWYKDASCRCQYAKNYNLIYQQWRQRRFKVDGVDHIDDHHQSTIKELI